MNAETNPYLAPSAVSGPISESKKPKNLKVILLIVWPFVFMANMILPMLFGWDLLDKAGSIGVLCATLALLIPGWLLIAIWPTAGKRLIVGAILVALLQFFPVLHIILGVIAFEVTAYLGQATEMNDLQSASIDTEFGGFIITMLVGSGLLVIAIGMGTILYLILPKRFSLATENSASTSSGSLADGKSA
jgi:hypothetical protein